MAIAIATPLPRYKHGTPQEGHPGGPAIVGDGGRSEFVILPDGKIFITPNKSTVIDLPKDSHVLPDLSRFLQDSLNFSMKPILGVPIDHSDEKGAIIKELRAVGSRLGATILNKRENHWYWKDGQMKNIVKRGNDQTEYINRNVRN